MLLTIGGIVAVELRQLARPLEVAELLRSRLLPADGGLLGIADRRAQRRTVGRNYRR